jgi:hypothetical protein
LTGAQRTASWNQEQIARPHLARADRGRRAEDQRPPRSCAARASTRDEPRAAAHRRRAVLVDADRIVGIGDDFALIDIYPEMQQYVNPSMAYFGGPTAAGDPQFGDIVQHSGHGVVIGTGGTPRAGVVVYRGAGDTNSADAFAGDGAASPGDSGSAVRLANGETAGDLVGEHEADPLRRPEPVNGF